MTSPIPLSILDLAPIADGTSTVDALAETIKLAQLGDALGFNRLWYAEHHGMPSIASSVPEILIGSAAAHTKSIRVGSGGVMLLNHAPLRIVEAYRTLEALHPGRIDLGLGRAPGGDRNAMQALRTGGGEEFSNYFSELMAFEEASFPPGHPYSHVPVAPGGISLPPLWLLGSSGSSAQAAGQLGIGYAFAAHFSQTPPKPAFDAYRYAFTPTEAFPKPKTIMAVSVICAPTDEEAQFLSGSQALQWALFHGGEVRRLHSPEHAAAHNYTAQQRAVIQHQSATWIIGSPSTVRDEIMAKIEHNQPDELMVTTTIHDYGLRRRSYSLLAQAFGLEPRS